eukprot:gene6783-8652_t
MQTRNPFLDEFSKLATSAAGVAQGVGEEARAFWRSQMERMVLDMDLVRRDEFDAVKDLAAAARAEADSFDANASKSAFKSSHTKKIGQKQLKALAQRLRRAPF